MWQVVGHDWVVTVLENSIAIGKVSHAYLFTGPPHVGRTTLALELAQALNCEGKDKPCGECAPCRKIKQGIHPDVWMVDLQYQARLREEPREQQQVLRIDTIRSVRGEVSLKPFEGRRRVFIIPEAERMTNEAANALLKTLEEPPPHAVLILIASDARSLLPTIVSRCQVFALRQLPTSLIEAELRERHGVAEEQAALLARLSGGRIGWAITAAHDTAILEERRDRLQQLVALAKMGRIDRLDYAEQLSRQARSVGGTLELWLDWWRDLLLVKAGCADMISNLDFRTSLEEQAGRHDLREISVFTEAIRRTIRHLQEHANLRLALEVLMLDLPSSRD